jgi:FKBP-type peptidyl-prolyl cis-trans isomerase
MNKSGITLASVFLIALFATSCLNIDETEKRTAADEQGELAQLLQQLISKGNNIDTTALGVYYVKITQGTGEFPKTGDTLSVGYAAYFVDGRMFDASYLHNTIDSTYSFVLGTTPMIKGWDDGMKLLNKDAKAQLIIPSLLAYGSDGIGMIKPYQPLVFVVKMKSIKPKK